jgi:hypothetical protein
VEGSFAVDVPREASAFECPEPADKGDSGEGLAPLVRAGAALAPAGIAAEFPGE